VEFVSELYELGYRLFLLDEVHRYAFWSKDLKQLYDDYDDIQVIATGSSILDISKGNADLSRRASVYQLHGLSFREYLNFQSNQNLSSINLDDVLSRHHILVPELLDSLNIMSDFEDYLKFGYFPFFWNQKVRTHKNCRIPSNW
jgi:uncharacterized protein